MMDVPIFSLLNHCSIKETNRAFISQYSYNYVLFLGFRKQINCRTNGKPHRYL